MSLTEADLDQRSRAAAGDVASAASNRAESWTLEGLHARRAATRTRRQFAGVGVLALLIMSVALFVRLPLDEESSDGGSVGIVDQPVEPPPAPVDADAGDVVILADGSGFATYLDPAAETAVGGQRLAGFRQGDQPHQLIESGGRLVVGWGEVSSTALDGTDAVRLGTAEYAVPAAEDGTVWLIDYPGSSIDTRQPATASRVDVGDGRVIESGAVPAGVFPEHGIPGGLAVIGQDDDRGLFLWDAEGGGALIEVASNGQVAQVDARGGVLVFCEEICQSVGAIDVERPGQVFLIPLGSSVQATPGSLQLSADGNHLAVGVDILGLGDEGEGEGSLMVAELSIVNGIDLIGQRLVEPDGAGPPLWVAWSATSDLLYLAAPYETDDDALDFALYQVTATGEILSRDRTRGVVPLSGAAVVVPRATVSIPPPTAEGLAACDGGPTPTGCRWTVDDPLTVEATPTATRTPDTDAPHNELDVPLLGRYAHTVTWTGSEVVVWGGDATYNGSGPAFGDGAVFDPSSSRWRPMAPSPAEPTSDHLAVWTGEEVLFLGGWQNPRQLVGYDPVQDTWTTRADAPFEVTTNINPFYNAAVWTGERMLVWSGADGMAAYDPTEDRWEALTGPPVEHRYTVALHVDPRSDPASVVAVGGSENLQGIDVAIRQPDGQWTEGPELNQLIDADKRSAHIPQPSETVLTDAGLLVVPSQGAPIPAALWDLTGDWIELPTPPKPGCASLPRPIRIDGGMIVGNLCGNGVRFDAGTRSFTPFESDGPMGSNQVVWTGEELIAIEPTSGVGSAAGPAMTSWRMAIPVDPSEEE